MSDLIFTVRHNRKNMKTIFDKGTQEALIVRIDSLDENSKALWGKMRICQMLRHCALCDGMLLGQIEYKRIFLRRLFGKIALKGMIKDEKPVRRNLTTVPEGKVREYITDFATERQKWIVIIQAYSLFSGDYFEHAFFGKITRQQAGRLSYKHADHHLRQFNH